MVAAFATGRGDQLASAMADRMHQPYRAQACPLLPVLLPLAGTGEVLGVALSGAGPSVLLVLRRGCERRDVEQTVRGVLEKHKISAELLLTSIAPAHPDGPAFEA